MKQALLKITGKVQGVFYRAGCLTEAEKLELNGYARNMPDGGVEVLLQGDEEIIKEFIKWAKNGPERAAVKDVEIFWQPIGEIKKDFRIF